MIKESFNSDIEAALKVLNEGGVILYPTDTVWGLGCDATNELAVQKIYDLKQRPGAKALVVLVADERDILKHVAHPDLELFTFLETLEKPTTVIYDGAIGFAENLVAEDGSIAIRIVKDAFCKTLIKRFRKPIVSTSANLSGEITPGNFVNISQPIKDECDYIVVHKQDDEIAATPSSIIKWNKDGTPTYIRK